MVFDYFKGLKPLDRFNSRVPGEIYSAAEKDLMELLAALVEDRIDQVDIDRYIFHQFPL